MIWLTWRQFRAQAASVLLAVAAFAVVLAVTGPRLLDLARIDANIFDRLTRADRDLYYGGIAVMALAPAIIGAFWGAPLVARELEAGTHRLVWNQTVTRARWLAAKLGVTALAAAAATGVLAWAITWWSGPLDGALSSTRGSLPARLTPVSFAMRGIVPVGYALFALALGVAFGIVLRKPLPAMALTLAVYTAVQIAVPLWVRPHLVAPVSQRVAFSRTRLDAVMADGAGRPTRLIMNTGGRGDWVLTNETVNANGTVATLPSWVSTCFPGPSGTASPQPVRSNPGSCFTRLNAEGYRQHLVYQPANRFWALQRAETALFLALSAILTAFAFWWARRRLS